ncbi:MAG: SH3 domain-containing protein [Lewinellaceae bacterium]|nr:SH3 domain-containing protein [Lewinellaceae bacterium]
MAFLGTLCSLGVYGQQYPPPKPSGVMAVISPDGLRLRAGPDADSKVLWSAPFGEKVTVLNDEPLLLDTVGYLYEFNDNIPINGYWTAVRCRGIRGYMFSAFLGQLATVRAEDKGLNEDFILLFPGSNCINNTFYKPGYYWYGYYDVPGKRAWKPVRPRFFSLTDWLSEYRISTESPDGLQFIVGSRLPLNIKGDPGIDFLDGNLIRQRDSLLLDSHVQQQFELKVFPLPNGYHWESLQLFAVRNGQQQALSHLPYDYNGDPYAKWTGDLDGDGRKDFIITFGDKSSKTMLFLSSRAKKGELVHPVAVFYAAYCC